MRISALRVWFTHAVHQSAVAARRVGTMIGRKIREATGGSIERGAGVGDDESEFGGGRSRAWIQEVLDDARKALLALFEKSFFERFPRFQKHLRRLLGAAPAPALAPPEKRTGPPRKLGAHTPSASEALELRRQIDEGIRSAHTREHAGLRDSMDRRRKG